MASHAIRFNRVARRWIALTAAATLIVGLAVAATRLASADVGVDITDNGGTITEQHNRSRAAEGIGNLIDNDPATKFMTFFNAVWMRYQSTTPAIIYRYTLTSANDAADRDPRDWRLEGSPDGVSWTTLDTQSAQTFVGRGTTRGYAVTTPTAYSFFQLTVTATNGSRDFQLAEWSLWSGGDGVPNAPSGLQAGTVSTAETDLIWADNSSNANGYGETGFEIERSTDGVVFTRLATAGADVNHYSDSTLSGAAKYYYRVRAVTATTASAYSNVATVAASTGQEMDITDLPGVFSDQYKVTGVEGVEMAADGTVFSKYLAYNTTTWLQDELEIRATVTRYTVTSANDAPDRDPRSWTMEGSVDGTSWTTLDTRTDEVFPGRLQRRSYSLANTTAYRYYRLRITANHGSGITQLAEWRLYGIGSGTPPSPAAPTGLAVSAVSDDHTVVTWRNNGRWAKSYRLERSTAGGPWDWSRILPAGTTRYIDIGLSGTTAYTYRVRAENAVGFSPYSNSASATTSGAGLPATWQEHWFEHNQLITRVYYDQDLAVYFDSDMDQSQTWTFDYVGKLWRYTKQTYGSFSDPRLAANFHQGKYGGGHPSTYFDSGHDYRNVIEMGMNAWSSTDAQARDMIAHEIGHIVESAAFGVHGSPSFPLWRDSKWCEIFQYDAYVGSGLTADAERWYASKINTRDGFPRADTAWFRDWFYPIWRDHGHSAVLVAYFRLLAQNFASINGDYVRALNWGEFVHFWSGAAGVNLKPLATTAFGWPSDWQQQFVQAQADFPDVQYAR